MGRWRPFPTRTQLSVSVQCMRTFLRYGAVERRCLVGLDACVHECLRAPGRGAQLFQSSRDRSWEIAQVQPKDSSTNGMSMAAAAIDRAATPTSLLGLSAFSGAVVSASRTARTTVKIIDSPTLYDLGGNATPNRAARTRTANLRLSKRLLVSIPRTGDRRDPRRIVRNSSSANKSTARGCPGPDAVSGATVAAGVSQGSVDSYAAVSATDGPSHSVFHSSAPRLALRAMHE